MEGMREHGQAQPDHRGKYFYEPAAVQARQRQADPEESGIERMLPAHQENADDGQTQQPAPAALLETIGIDIVGILGCGKPQRRHPGVDNPIQDGVKFTVEDQEDAQHGQPFEGFFDQRGNHGASGNICGKIRAGEDINPHAQGGIDEEGASGSNDGAPQKDAAQK